MTIGLQKLHNMLNYPIIKPEDGGVLQFFALFLTGCLNAMFGVMEDLDNAKLQRHLLTSSTVSFKKYGERLQVVCRRNQR